MQQENQATKLRPAFPLQAPAPPVAKQHTRRLISRVKKGRAPAIVLPIVTHNRVSWNSERVRALDIARLPKSHGDIRQGSPAGEGSTIRVCTVNLFLPRVVGCLRNSQAAVARIEFDTRGPVGTEVLRTTAGPESGAVNGP